MAQMAGSRSTRKQQATPSRPDLAWCDLWPHGCVKLLVLAGLLIGLFRAELGDLIRLWATDPDWSHGFLIPLFSLYFIHQKRTQILGLEYASDPLSDLLQGRRPSPLPAGGTRPNYLGLLLLLAVLGLYAFNVVSPAGYAYLRPISMIAAVGAVVLFLGGWRLLRYTWLPIVFLAFAVPLPRRYYVELTMPMRRLAATVATALLNAVPNLDATAGGTIIEIVYKGRRLEPALDVEAACSGMRLLMAFLALGVAMAYLHERPAWQRAILLLSTAPIAVLCNIVRVTATGFLYVLAGPHYTQGAYHDALGLAMLPLALGLYAALAWFMSSLFVEEDDGGGPELVIARKRTA